MLRKKQTFSLVISKLMSAFSLWLCNLVQPTIILTNTSSKNNSESLRGVTILSRLLNFGMSARSTTLISRFSNFLKQVALDSWDNIYFGLPYLSQESMVLSQLQLAYIILSFLLQSYKITELQLLWISD